MGSQYESVTVPSGQVWVIRDMEIYAEVATVYCVVAEVTLGNWFYWQAGAAHDSRQWKGRFVLEEGDTLGVILVDGTSNFIAGGYKLGA